MSTITQSQLYVELRDRGQDDVTALDCGFLGKQLGRRLLLESSHYLYERFGYFYEQGNATSCFWNHHISRAEQFIICFALVTHCSNSAV